jgi:hypothetical protein
MFAAHNLLMTLQGSVPVLPAGFVSAATAEATTLTMPTHAATNVLYMFAFRDGTAVAPTLPAGWTQIGSAAANSCAAILAYKIAASSSETSGTWTNANELVCQVYSGAYGKDFTVAFQTGSSATVTYPALTLLNTDGSSVVAAFGGHRSTNGSMGTAPTGMTQRANREGATADAAGFDTNGGVTSWSTQNVASGETASGYITCVVEVLPSGFSGMRLDSQQSTFVTAASATLATAVSSGAYALIDIICDSNVTISSVTFGGTTITTNDTTTINGSATNGKVWRYYVPSATAANQSAVVTMSASTNIVVGVMSYLGATSRSTATTVSSSGFGSGTQFGTQTPTVNAGERAVMMWGTADAVVRGTPGTAGINRINNVSSSNTTQALIVTDGFVSGTYGIQQPSGQTIDWGGIANVLSP